MACFWPARNTIGANRSQPRSFMSAYGPILSRCRNKLLASTQGGREARPDCHNADAMGEKAMERSILGWLLIGLVAGVLGKLIMPGRDPGGFIVTILIGIAGAFLAGFIAKSMHIALVGGWENYAAATGGAVIVLALYRIVVVRRNR